MRVVLQRVSRAEVRIEGATVGSIGPGLVLLVGFTAGDDEHSLDWMAEKILGLRIFSDHDGKMNLDLAAIEGGILVVSQFTLYGDTARGRRPSFVKAAPPADAIPLYEGFVARLTAKAPGPVATGRFGASMQVDLVNDGPVTLVLER
jgi:D-tyrosyl-tRNA(Tyr) deacylase